MTTLSEQLKKGKSHLKGLTKEELLQITDNMLEWLIHTGSYSDWWDSVMCDLESAEGTPMSELIDAIYED